MCAAGPVLVAGVAYVYAWWSMALSHGHLSFAILASQAVWILQLGGTSPTMFWQSARHSGLGLRLIHRAKGRQMASPCSRLRAVSWCLVGVATPGLSVPLLVFQLYGAHLARA